MHVRGRKHLQDALTAVRHKLPLAQCGARLFANAERYLRPLYRLARIYPPELLAETLAIAERCTFSLGELRYEYPEEVVPPGETPATYLRRAPEETALLIIRLDKDITSVLMDEGEVYDAIVERARDLDMSVVKGIYLDAQDHMP